MIDFGKPFQHAWENQVRVLFTPFDLGKWCSLGFTAWLASFVAGGGSGSNFNFPGGSDYTPSKEGSTGNSQAANDFFETMLGLGLPFWLLILALIALFLCLIVFVFIALGCRGQFMFLDNVLHNRSEIKKPWKEFGSQANELTVWHTLLSLVPLLLIFVYLGAALTWFWGDIATKTTRSFMAYLPWIGGFVFLILLFIPLGLVVFLLHEFGVPIMAKHRCSVAKTFGHLWFLLKTRFWDCVVFTIIRIAMGFCFAFLSLFLGCCTCCIGFLPYVSTVMTLPYHVFQQTFTLDCLAQFGNEYNLWPVLPPPPPTMTP